MRNKRFRLLLALIILVPLGLATKVYEGPAASIVRGSAGGAIYVVFWSLFLMFFRPSLSPIRVVVAVTIATCGIELLQLWHPPFLEALRRTIVGKLLLGTTFAWQDFPAYFVGGVLAGLLASVLTGKSEQPGNHRISTSTPVNEDPH